MWIATTMTLMSTTPVSLLLFPKPKRCPTLWKCRGGESTATASGQVAVVERFGEGLIKPVEVERCGEGLIEPVEVERCGEGLIEPVEVERCGECLIEPVEVGSVGAEDFQFTGTDIVLYYYVNVYKV